MSLYESDYSSWWLQQVVLKFIAEGLTKKEKQKKVNLPLYPS